MARTVPSRTGANARVPRSTRGSGRPGHEPDGSRKTGRPIATGARRVDAGSGAAPRVRTSKEAYRWIADASRSRRASRTPRACRLRSAMPCGPGCAISPSTSRPRPWRRSRGTSGCCSPGRRRSTSPRSGNRRRSPATTSSTASRRSPWLRSRGTGRLLDLGSGGGFPGLPLAAALPGLETVLLEPIAKKTRFLRTVAEATELDARVSAITARAEQLGRDDGHRGRWPVVTARAVASTADLVELAFPLLAPGGSLIAWKRGELEAELVAARTAMAALGGGRHRGRRGRRRGPRRSPAGGGHARRPTGAGGVPARAGRPPASTVVTRTLVGPGPTATLFADAHRRAVGHP